MAEKVTVMVLKVDLHCSTCCKKIKRLLCQFPQIRDQIYDEKQNQVVITVVCCCPEKIRDKLYCKGGKVIKCIKIREADPPPKPTPPTKLKPNETVKPKTPEKTKEEDKTKGSEKLPSPPKEDPKPNPLIHVEVQYGYPPPFPNSGCCGPCSEGYPGGPCYHGYRRPATPPPPPRPYCDGYGYRYGYGGNKGCYVSRCDYYFSEENPKGCTIM